ncbi:hypothetical protein Rhopal_005642-T1 [Rhodotorula paludigena]|uniref:Uncharacterized protein n=1 Tax=Rhodotorula paludigena TaxID=86838 RepID=A0AAV5GTB0_9BASI|nr:hypothetical protein Rhopal_005642-T1 [Rhodotorula paludigena]
MSSRGPTVSPSGTPGSRRYNPSSVGTAPPTASQRQRRRLLILLGAVAGVVALVLVVVLPSTLLTRDDGGSDAESQSVVTTVIDGVTRTITNAEVVTRSRLSTLDNGEITTLTSVVNLPVITVSPSAIATVQPEIVTTTLSGGAVIVVEEATSLRTQVATVTFTASNGVVGVETLTLTSFELVTPGFDDEHQFQLVQLVQCDDDVGDCYNEQHFHQHQLDHGKPIEHDRSAIFDYHEQLYEQSEHELEQHGLIDDAVDVRRTTSSSSTLSTSSSNSSASTTTASPPSSSSISSSMCAGFRSVFLHRLEQQQHQHQQQQLVLRIVVYKRHHNPAANIVFVKLRQYLDFELQRELELDFDGRLRVDERDEQLFQLKLLIFQLVDHRFHDTEDDDDRAVADRDNYVGGHGRALHHPGTVPARVYRRADQYEWLDEQYSDYDDDHEHHRRTDVDQLGRAVYHPGNVPARMHGQFDVDHELDKPVVVYQLELVYHVPPKCDYLHDLDPLHERVDDFGPDLRLAGHSCRLHGRVDPASDNNDDDDESQHDKHYLVSLSNDGGVDDNIGKRFEFQQLELAIDVAVQLSEPYRRDQLLHDNCINDDERVEFALLCVSFEHDHVIADVDSIDVKLEQIHCERRRRRRLDEYEDDLVFLNSFSFVSLKHDDDDVFCDHDRPFRPDR